MISGSCVMRQERYFNTSCMIRGSRVPVILPKVAGDSDVHRRG